MRSLLLALICFVCLILVVSCEKDHNCTCTYRDIDAETGEYENYSDAFAIYDATKSEAKQKCQELEIGLNLSPTKQNISCGLK